jgi:phosphatidylserine/phosphatidylglycerophosphate/cardiolipin synthase-like enzyme/regulation of enolase protein 1 (concanavalin A-like superfamily)
MAAVAITAVTAHPASAQDQMFFSAVDNVTQKLVQLINAETVRVEIASWYLSEHSISIAVANRWAAGVPVRIIGDRGAIFEGDPLHTKKEFYWLASQGIPIRLRVNPTWYPEIMHWKAAILVGQNKVLFGSGNFAPTELAPVSATNYCDESEMVTDDPVLVGAFKTKFDVMWNDTTQEPSFCCAPPYLMNWDQACAVEHTGGCADYTTLYPNPVPMVISTARLEPDNPMPPDLIWGQGSMLNNRMVQEINKETTGVDILVYRLTVPNITNALLAKSQAGVPVRIIVDTFQYANRLWPEYWLTHAYIDQLYAAGVSVRQRVHDGVMHMKTLITSNYASNASSNYAAGWQRDHDYFISATAKPTMYQALKNRFQTMWTDNVGFTAFSPQPPDASSLSAPATGSGGVSATPTLVWNIAAFATSYDVYLGTTSSNMSVVANVPAQLNNNPPSTYSWTATTALASGTTYFWKIVSRTFATPVKPTMIATSPTWTFTTAGTGSLPGVPGSPNPADGATSVATSATLTWTAAGATSYDVSFGTTSTPPIVSAGQTSSSYTPSGLAGSTTYFWQIVARNSVGSTTGPVWSFTTGAVSTGVPPPWANADVGNTGKVGSASYVAASGTFTVKGAGANIWGTSDGFQYVYQPLAGDGTIVARVTAVGSNTSQFAKAGVMIRESLADNAAHVVLDLRPTNDIEFMTRPATGGQTNWINGAVQAPPAWLKLTRTGSTVTGAVSGDGSTWTTVGTTTLSISSAMIGLIVSSQNTGALNTSTFDNVSVSTAAAPPSAPGTPSPVNGATGVSATPTLTWSASGATAYDVSFGTTNPPPQVSTDQAAASYSPGALADSTIYFWQITAKNSTGTTAGPVWSFTTAAAPPPPAVPNSPNPADGSTGIGGTATLTWTAAGATSYDVSFGTSNPPTQVSPGQAGASYATGVLTTGTTYFWQVAARNSAGTTNGPVWSFTTAVAPPPVTNIVIYASDIPGGALHGSWATASDSTSPNGVKLVTPDLGVANTANALAAPTDYIDVTFNAPAGTQYNLWLRLQATGNSKFNDSVWVQFSDAKVGASSVYPINTTQSLLVNLATTVDATSLNGWGWQNTAYWLSQATKVTFATSGTHTLRIQVREDGVQLDQIVLSPTTYLNTAPGPVGGDTTIVPKP